MIDQEERFNAIVGVIWAAWTDNGLDMDKDERHETYKAVQDAANSTWVDGMQDAEWIEATLVKLVEEDVSGTLLDDDPDSQAAHDAWLNERVKRR